MSIADNLDEAQKKVKELQDQLRDLTLEPSAIIDISNITKANNAINTLTKAVTAAKKEASDLEDGFGGVFNNVTKIVGELKNGNNAANLATKAFKSIQDITQKLKYDQQDISKLDIDQLKSLQKKLKINQQEVKDQAKSIIQRENLNSGTDAQIKASIEMKLALGQITEEEAAIVRGAREGFTVFKETNDLLDKRIQKEEEVNKTMGLTKLALEGMGKIPIVGPLLDVNKALDAARKKAEDEGHALQSLGAAAGSMGKSLVSSLGDPLVVIGLLVKGFQMFMDIGFKTDKQIVSLSKSMGVSQEAAEATREHMVGIQNNSDEIFNRIENQINAQLELADAFGVTIGFTDQQIQGQIDLTKKMGLTAEEAAGINKLAMANGMTAKNVTDTVVKQTQALAKQTGIQLDNKQVVQDVAKVSGQLRLQYANNPKLIAKAVVETKKLGINMEIAANAAKGLLQFEDSIENELSAELLTGKALNLERARGLALNGDSVGAAKEMLAQVGSAADFQNMNVIQQEAIAKAIGMSTDDLANSLVTQENLSKLGGETRKQIEEQIKAAKALGTEEGDQLARRLEASAFSDKAAIKALESVDQQAKFNELIEKMKSMLASVVEGPAKQFLDYMLGTTDGVSNMAAPLKSVFDTLAGIVNFVKEYGSQLVIIAKIAGIIKAAQIGYNLALGVGMMFEKQKTRELKKQGIMSGIKAAFSIGGSSFNPIAALAIITTGIAAAYAAFAMFNKGGSVPGTNTKSDSVPALLTSGEYVIPNSNGKTGTEKYNEMISPKTPVMLNEGGTVSINSNKGNLTPSLPPDNKGNNQDLTSLISSINSLQNNIKSLIQIQTDFLKELKLILTSPTKIPTKETPIKNETSLVKIPTKETPIKNETSLVKIPTKETPIKNETSLVPLFTNFLKELKLILTPTTKIPTKETNLTKETSLKKEVTPLDLLNVLNPFSTMLKVGSLLLSKSIETKNNSIKPIENNSIESKQTNIDQNVVKPIGDNTTTPKQNNIDQNVNKSTTFSLFNFQNDTSKSDTGVIQAINGLRSDLKALASRPIHTSVQLDGKELATMQGKYPNEAGDANGKVAYQMS